MSWYFKYLGVDKHDLGVVLVELIPLADGRYLEMVTQRFENTHFAYNSSIYQ